MNAWFVGNGGSVVGLASVEVRAVVLGYADKSSSLVASRVATDIAVRVCAAAAVWRLHDAGAGGELGSPQRRFQVTRGEVPQPSSATVLTLPLMAWGLCWSSARRAGWSTLSMPNKSHTKRAGPPLTAVNWRCRVSSAAPGSAW